MIIVYCRVDDTLEKNIWNSFEYEGDPRNNVYYLSSSKIKAPEKNSGLYGIWTHDLCDTGAALYQLR